MPTAARLVSLAGVTLIGIIATGLGVNVLKGASATVCVDRLSIPACNKIVLGAGVLLAMFVVYGCLSLYQRLNSDSPPKTDA
jgi:hypothetical protein